MADDNTREEVLDKAIDRAVEVEEYEAYGRRLKGPALDTLLKARTELGAEDRVRRQGNILARAGHVVARREK